VQLEYCIEVAILDDVPAALASPRARCIAS
jgi:hypothetical protein